MGLVLLLTGEARDSDSDRVGLVGTRLGNLEVVAVRRREAGEKGLHLEAGNRAGTEAFLKVLNASFPRSCWLWGLISQP